MADKKKKTNRSTSNTKKTDSAKQSDRKNNRKDAQPEQPHVKVASRSANYKEISAIILIAVCVFLVVCIIGKAGIVGDLVNTVLRGLFGLFGSIMIIITLVVFAITILRGTRASVFTGKTTVIIVFFILSVSSLFHTLSGLNSNYTTPFFESSESFFKLFGNLWSSSGQNSFGGGVIAGGFSTLLQALVTHVGALVIQIPLTLILTLLLFRFSLLPFFTGVGRILKKIGKGIVALFKRIFGRKNTNDHAPIRVIHTNAGRQQDDDEEETDTPAERDAHESFNEKTEPVRINKVIFEDPDDENAEAFAVDVDGKIPKSKRITDFNVKFDDIDEDGSIAAKKTEADNKPAPEKTVPERTASDSAVRTRFTTDDGKIRFSADENNVVHSEDEKDSYAQTYADDPVEVYKHIEPGKLPLLATGEYANYKAPPLELLSYDENKKSEALAKMIKENETMMHNLQNLFDSRGIDVTCESYNMGPSFTQFVVVPKTTQEVKGIKGLADDISVHVSGDDVRIEAPIPGENAIGIEMANKSTFPVYQRDLIGSREFKNLPAEDLPVALGMDIRGNNWISTMKDMIHIMIGGTTGSGKSVFTQGLILSLIYKASPEQVRLILVDPKKTEFMVFKSLPHLITPVIVEPDKAVAALGWVTYEMRKRYDFFERFELNNIEAYNKVAEKKGLPKLPRIVVVIDEFMDLMQRQKEKTNEYCRQLSSLARACGIHLVLATQRPSADVFPGQIKANMPSKVCLLVRDNLNSRIIIDRVGGEKLNGKGDMLCLLNGEKREKRLQNGYCDPPDIKEIVGYIKVKNHVNEKPAAQQELEDSMAAGPSGAEQLYFDGMSSAKDDDYTKVLKYVITRDDISISEIQRKCAIGYNHAATILDRLIEEGYVEDVEQKGSKKRQVLKKEID